MPVVKPVLAASVILATLGLAGCQTTEERVHYSSVQTSPSYVYEDEEPVVYRSPSTVYVAPPVRYVRPAPVHFVRPPVQDYRPMPPPHYRPAPHYRPVPPPPPRVVAPPRHYGAPYGGMRRPYGVNGNSPGYDTQ